MFSNMNNFKGRIAERFSIEYYQYNNAGKSKVKNYYFTTFYTDIYNTKRVGLYYLCNTRTLVCEAFPLAFDDRIRRETAAEDLIKVLKTRTHESNEFTVEKYDKFPFE